MPACGTQALSLSCFWFAGARFNPHARAVTTHFAPASNPLSSRSVCARAGRHFVIPKFRFNHSCFNPHPRGPSAVTTLRPDQHPGFNPRAPRGQAWYRAEYAEAECRFNPRAPRGSATDEFSWAASIAIRFNPRAPRRRDSRDRCQQHGCRFNPAPRAGTRRPFPVRRGKTPSFNPRAPRAGPRPGDKLRGAS